MHAGDDQYVLIHHPEEKAVGKPAEECALRLAMDHRVPVRTLLDRLERFSDRLKEFFSQASPLLLIPLERILDISSGSGT